MTISVCYQSVNSLYPEGMIYILYCVIHEY